VSAKSLRFWPLLFVLASSDCATKRIAQTRLVPAHVPHPVAGEVVRLTLTYNRGAAFGIDPGPHGRWVLVTLSLGVIAGLALRARGAIGNLIDRIRSARGVVDFIDLGIGDARLWAFNVADLGISTGAALLVFALWRRGRAPAGPIPPR
jgi:signal peptidase II